MSNADATKLQDLKDLVGSRADRVHASIKSAILSLDFKPGDIIRKPDICDRLGVSRSPVSDALTKLASEGLVDIVPQSGTRVSLLSMDAIREDTFLREALEVAAVRHAALHRSPEIVAKLKRNLEMQRLLVLDVDKEDFIRNDSAMHEIIFSTTGVVRLPAMVSTVSIQVNRARLLMVPEPGSMAETIKEHVQIIDAIEQQDELAAQQAMRQHVRQLLKRLEAMAAAHSDLISS